MSAINEQNLVSVFSNVAEFIAASLPSQITFSANPINMTTLTSIQIEWQLPTIVSGTDLPINYYNIYWNEGYRSSGDFVLLD